MWLFVISCNIVRKYYCFDFYSLVQSMSAQLGIWDSQLLEQILEWFVAGIKAISMNKGNGSGKDPCKSFSKQMRPEVHAVLI